MGGAWGDIIGVLLGMACVVGVFVGGLLVVVSFLSAVARALRRVEPENRRMTPGEVWLNLVPVFNLVWAPVTVERVAESLRNEYQSRGVDSAKETYGRSAGITLLTLLAFCGFFELVSVAGEALAPLVAVVPLYLIAFVYWIVYWAQLGRYARELKSGTYRAPPVDEGW